MIIKRKLFSFKRTLAGIKGGLKDVPRGAAMAGAMFIPGKSTESNTKIHSSRISKWNKKKKINFLSIFL